ncbi:MAG TPA: GNAT family N-acetyltransferase [Nocardioidaceae bacterium]
MSLSLIALSAESIRRVYAGESDWAAGQPDLSGVVWPADDRRVLRYRVEALDSDPEAAPFLLHAAVQDGGFVGRIGSHAAPDAGGAVEIGYAVVPSARGQGVGGQIVDLFLTWLSARGVTRVDASVGPDNVPSLRLLKRRGFVEVGERWDDEDGRELVLSKALEPRPRSSDDTPTATEPPAT